MLGQPSEEWKRQEWMGPQGLGWECSPAWYLDFRLASRTMTQEICLVFIYPEMVVLAVVSGSIMTNSLACILSLSHRAFDFHLIRWMFFSWKHFQLLLPLLSDIEILGDTKLSGSHQTQLDIMTLFCTNLFCLLPCSFRGVLFKGFSPHAGMEMSDGPPQQLIWMACEDPHDDQRLNSKLEKTWIHRLTYTQCRQLVCQGS